MSGRENTPVEELIGWTEISAVGDLRWRDGESMYREAAEVDDLADWLDTEGYDVRPPYDHNITSRPQYLIVTATHRAKRPNRSWFEETVEGPTILAALEAAVRAVHEQEATNDDVG